MSRAHALRQRGDLEGAARLYRQLEEVEPGYAEASFWLGMLAQQAGKLAAAESYLQRSIDADPAQARPYAAMGSLQRKLGRPAEAIAAFFERALVHDPELFVAHSNLGAVYVSEHRYEKALGHLQCAIALDGTAMQPRLLLANLFNQLGRVDDAINAYRAVVERWPDAMPAYASLASLLDKAGQPEERQAMLRAAIRRDPTYGANWYFFSLKHAFVQGDPVLAELESILSVEKLTPGDRAMLEFALGKARLDCGCYDESWECFVSANSRLQSAAGVAPQRPPDDGARARRQDLDRPLPSYDGDGPRSILVLGLSRSGKSLLESVLGRLPGVVGAGERPWLWREAVRHVTEKTDAPALDDTGLRVIGAGLLADIGERYRRRLSEAYPAAQAFVSTAPEIASQLGLMAHALPGVKVVYCRRNRLDNILAIWRHYYGSRYCDLAEIAGVYDAYEALVAHWRQRYPGLVYTLEYEDLVTRPAEVFAGVFEHCGLAGDVSSVGEYFHDREVGLWRHFRQHLEHL